MQPAAHDEIVLGDSSNDSVNFLDRDTAAANARDRQVAEAQEEEDSLQIIDIVDGDGVSRMEISEVSNPGVAEVEGALGGDGGETSVNPGAVGTRRAIWRDGEVVPGELVEDGDSSGRANTESLLGSDDEYP